jgi:hypothetical protein
MSSTSQTVRSGYLDPSAPPAATVAPGDTVRYPNTWTHWGNEAVYGMTFADREPLRHRYPHGPYSMVGPVEVTGAVPGDVIDVHAPGAAHHRLGLELLPARRRRAAGRLRPAPQGGIVNDPQPAPAAPLSFARDIRPLFRDKDRTSMLKAFDLWSHADVVTRQDAILDQVRGGTMPSDGAWPPEQTVTLAQCIAGGSQP